MNPSAYFEEVLSLISSAELLHTDRLSLAGRTVHLKTPSPGLRERLVPSLAHLIKPDDGSAPELTIWYATNKNLASKVKAPPWAGFNSQGYNPDLDQDEIQIFFQPWQKQFFLYSRTKRTGIYWAQTPDEVPWWESTFSFRVLFHFWTYDLPAQLIHAGALAHNGSGILITGQSGSGKSTSCLQLLRRGFQYLGDDYVWVEQENGGPSVHTLFQTAKVEPENLHNRFHDWVPYVTNKDTYRDQKAIFHVHDLFPDSRLGQAKLKAILLPRVSGLEHTSFEKVNSSRALLAMAPTTLHHLPHNRDISYKKLMEISASLPSYHWKLGYNLYAFFNSFKDFSTHELSWN